MQRTIPTVIAALLTITALAGCSKGPDGPKEESIACQTALHPRDSDTAQDWYDAALALQKVDPDSDIAAYLITAAAGMDTTDPGSAAMFLELAAQECKAKGYR